MGVTITFRTCGCDESVVFTGHYCANNITDRVRVTANVHSRTIIRECRRRAGCDIRCRILFAATACGDGQFLC